MKQRYTLSEINSLSHEEFVRLLGGVFEHSPWIAQVVSTHGPFASVEELHRCLCDVVREATSEQKLALICSHPDLVGRAALAGGLTEASTNEQESAGLSKLSPAEIATFQKNNEAYRTRFGFPFVICALLNKKAAILAGFDNRLKNDRAQEIQTALEEIFKIAELRIRDLVSN